MYGLLSSAHFTRLSLGYLTHVIYADITRYRDQRPSIVAVSNKIRNLAKDGGIFLLES
jgi:hypothetical protein